MKREYNLSTKRATTTFHALFGVSVSIFRVTRFWFICQGASLKNAHDIFESASLLATNKLAGYVNLSAGVMSKFNFAFSKAKSPILLISLSNSCPCILIVVLLIHDRHDYEGPKLLINIFVRTLQCIQSCRNPEILFDFSF